MTEQVGSVVVFDSGPIGGILEQDVLATTAGGSSQGRRQLAVLSFQLGQRIESGLAAFWVFLVVHIDSENS